MAQPDPTDHALATIASILDRPEARRPPEKTVAEVKPVTPPVMPAPPRIPTAVTAQAPVSVSSRFAAPPPVAPPVPVPGPAPSEDVHGYSKSGPGPMAAVRFKWTVRRAHNDEYYVDETIGENSLPVSSGPMSREAAVRMVDERERDARGRFEQIRSEMSRRESAAHLVKKDGEA